MPTVQDKMPAFPAAGWTRSAERRRRFVGRHLDHVTMRILEIGALDNPTFVKSEGAVSYLDWLPYEELLKAYDDARKKRAAHLVRPDFVANGVDFSRQTGSSGAFDLIVANHVLEHLPNPLRFFAEAALAVGRKGHMLLSIPDRRFTFDVNRVETDFVDWFRRFERDQINPDRHDLLRHFYYKVDYNRTMHDRGDTVARGARGRGWSDAWALAGHHAGSYTDVHVSVFTLDSFLTLWGDAEASGLVSWRVLDTDGPSEGDNEFRVIFERSPEHTD